MEATKDDGRIARLQAEILALKGHVAELEDKNRKLAFLARVETMALKHPPPKPKTKKKAVKTSGTAAPRRSTPEPAVPTPIPGYPLTPVEREEPQPFPRPQI